MLPGGQKARRRRCTRTTARQHGLHADRPYPGLSLCQGGVAAAAREQAFTPALCNRIDRNTGGIVIAAKTAEALRILNQKIRDRELDKRYLAVVDGHAHAREAGRCRRAICSRTRSKTGSIVTDTPQTGAKTCETRYRTLTKRGGLSLVECELITGRTHQIRRAVCACRASAFGRRQVRQARSAR